MFFLVSPTPFFVTWCSLHHFFGYGAIYTKSIFGVPFSNMVIPPLYFIVLPTPFPLLWCREHHHWLPFRDGVVYTKFFNMVWETLKMWRWCKEHHHLAALQKWCGMHQHFEYGVGSTKDIDMVYRPPSLTALQRWCVIHQGFEYGVGGTKIEVCVTVMT